MKLDDILSEAKQKSLTEIHDDLLVNKSAESIKLYRKAFKFHGDTHDDKEVLEIVHEDIKQFLAALKRAGRDKLPLRWSSRESGYSYNFKNIKPLEILASDGSHLKVKYLTDLALYANDWLDIATHTADWSIERFRPGHINQADHEGRQIRGDV